jgi:hypothetical protein
MFKRGCNMPTVKELRERVEELLRQAQIASAEDIAAAAIAKQAPAAGRFAAAPTDHASEPAKPPPEPGCCIVSIPGDDDGALSCGDNVTEEQCKALEKLGYGVSWILHGKCPH